MNQLNLDLIDAFAGSVFDEPIVKHGTHDQKTHGSWATGMGAGVADSILLRVRENGGLSVNMVDGSEPTSGYMVAKGGQYGSIVEAVDFYDPIKGPKALADYMKKHKTQLGGGKNYLGLWHNTEDGKVYLDVSENIQSKERAISAGQKQDQISIWDVVNFAEIQTGGTGSVEKTGDSRTSNEHRRDERFGNRSIRSENLGEVGKALKVIRFAAGLIPIFKHQEHDQSSHGNWARGISAEDEELINLMSSMGPSKEDILNALRGGEQADMSDLLMLVNNDQGLYSQATDGIEERVEEAFQEAKYEYEDKEANDKANEDLRNRLYEKIQDEMVDEFIQADDGSLAVLWEEENGGSFNPEDLHSYFDEVYTLEHEVTNNDGEVVTTLNSQTTNIYRDGDSLVVQGQVNDSNGNFAGEFQRSFYTETNDDGNEILVVEHDLFRMAEEYQGSGFGSKFLAQQEAYYVSKEIDAINVSTAWDGARHWARAGFDFNPKNIERTLNEIALSTANNYTAFAFGTPARQEFDALMFRAVEQYGSDANGVAFRGVKSMKEDTFPTPNDFAMIGYAQRVQSGTTDFGKPVYSWAGKWLLEGLNLKYRKGLTQEGRTLNQGPIDRDGDGLVYDGTAREKPVSEVNLTP